MRRLIGTARRLPTALAIVRDKGKRQRRAADMAVNGEARDASRLGSENAF